MVLRKTLNEFLNVFVSIAIIKQHYQFFLLLKFRYICTIMFSEECLLALAIIYA